MLITLLILNKMSENIHEDLLVVILLYNLSASFENFRCAIISYDKLPSPKTLRIKIIEQCDIKESNSNKLYVLGANAQIKQEPYKVKFR